MYTRIRYIFDMFYFCIQGDSFQNFGFLLEKIGKKRVNLIRLLNIKYKKSKILQFLHLKRFILMHLKKIKLF